MYNNLSKFQWLCFCWMRERRILKSVQNLWNTLYVTNLWVADVVSFEHEFFIWVARSFLLLDKLHLINLKLQSSCNINPLSSNDSQSYSIAKYPHLTLLDVRSGNIDNVEEFLNETKTSVACLTKLLIMHNDLKIVTKNFTREETRRNCTKIKQILVFNGLGCVTKDLSNYFPSL